MSCVPEDLPLELPLGGSIQAETAPALEQEVTDLFDCFRGNLLRYLCYLGLSMDDSEEIVQEVFLLLFEHLREEKSRENLRGWLFRVAHHLGLKRRAAVQAQSHVSAGEDGVAECWTAPGESPEEQLLFRQRRQRLLAVVDALPVQDRQCLYLRSEGLRYREIAEILAISLGSVAKSLSRSLERLANSEQRWNDAET
jgi:RNA polymerase sigma-70 factor (ECF subfamily)